MFSCRWPLHYGHGILGACSALSGMYVNSYFRSRLRLHTYGRVSSYLPVVALPALMSALFHQQVKQFAKLHGMFCITSSQIYWIVVSALFKKFPSYNITQRFITHKINCYCTVSYGMGIPLFLIQLPLVWKAEKWVLSHKEASNYYTMEDLFTFKKCFWNCKIVNSEGDV